MDEQERKPCNPHPKAPHGFLRNASHSLGRYVCECEGWDSYDAGYEAGFADALKGMYGDEQTIVERAEEAFDAAKQRGWVGLKEENT